MAGGTRFAACAKKFALFPGHPVLPIILRGTDGSAIRPGTIMHWVKWLIEIWILFGVVTVILGLLWTSRLSKESQPNVGTNTSSLRGAELSANHLSKVRSA